MKVDSYEVYGRSTFIYDRYITSADYKTGAERLTKQILEKNATARTLLDVGCGSGKYLEFLQGTFACEGLDVSAPFLAIARRRCPNLTFHQADMCDFSLPHRYDAISCLFLAIAYVKTVDRLERAIARMACHLNSGGTLFFEPWVYPQNFWENRLTSEYVNDPDMKISRMFIARKEGNLSIYDIHYLVGTSKGIEYFIEREELGLFAHEEYMGAIRKAGLVAGYDANKGLFEAHNIGMYWGVKP